MPRSFRLAMRLTLGSYWRMGNELYAYRPTLSFQSPNLRRTGPR